AQTGASASSAWISAMVEQLLRARHTVHVVYEACGFGFGLYRALKAAGAQCYVIAPRKLDEEHTRVKTDPRDATTLCQRLSRYMEGNARELAMIRVPTEAIVAVARQLAVDLWRLHTARCSAAQTRTQQCRDFACSRGTKGGALTFWANYSQSDST